MTEVFLDYSKYYDLLYKDKDYKSEAEFIIGLIKNKNPNAKSILNLGCGTGQHDLFLREAGFHVTGIDLSKEMLQIAKKKNLSCEYHHADARTIRLNQKFDVVISLFHVLSYQNSNQDVLDFLNTISNHLRQDGIAIFDYWYGPAVLNIKPENREKKFESDELLISRKATTKLNHYNNIATVNFNIDIQNKYSNDHIVLQEKHPMRYFFIPEIEMFAEISNFKILFHGDWMNNSKPSENSWTTYSVIRI